MINNLLTVMVFLWCFVPNICFYFLAYKIKNWKNTLFPGLLLYGVQFLIFINVYNSPETFRGLSLIALPVCTSLACIFGFGIVDIIKNLWDKNEK